MKPFLAMLLAVLSFSSSGCGTLSNSKNMLARSYFRTTMPDDPATCLVTWPFHLVILTGLYAVDQTLYAFVAIEPAAQDASDYFTLKGPGNNIMLERTIAVPKVMATPFVFAGSWITRWIFPVDDDTRVFNRPSEEVAAPSL